MATPFTRSYQIHDSRLDSVVAYLEGLSKTAVKLGLPAFVITQGNEVFVERKGAQGLADRYVELELTGVKPVLSGWRFLGKIEHLPEGNIIKGFDAGEVAERFHECKPNCDHCNTVRQRLNTFVLVDDKLGKQLQVGSSCISDFIGGHMDPHLVLELLDGLGKMQPDGMEPLPFEQDDGFGAGRGKAWGVYTRTSLELACAIMRKDGEYISKARAEEMRIPSTADEVANALFKRSPENNYAGLVTAADQGRAQAVLAWMGDKDSFDPSDNYRRNLSVLAKTEVIEPQKHLSLLVSAPVAYMRSQRDLEVSAESFHLGQVGEKLAGRLVRFDASPSFETRFGFSSNVLMTDIETGQQFKWKTSTAHHMRQGSTYYISGTINGHDEYRGRKQTNLTRVNCPDLNVLDGLRFWNRIAELSDNPKLLTKTMKLITDPNVIDSKGESLLSSVGRYASDEQQAQWKPLLEALLKRGADPLADPAGTGVSHLDQALTYGGGSVALTACYLAHLHAEGVDLRSVPLALKHPDANYLRQEFSRQQNAPELIDLLSRYGIDLSERSPSQELNGQALPDTEVEDDLVDELETNPVRQMGLRL